MLKRKSLQFLFGHDLHAHLLLAFPAPVVHHLFPILRVLRKLVSHLSGAKSCVAALGSYLALSHLQVFANHHHKLDLVDWERPCQDIVIDPLRAIRISCGQFLLSRWVASLDPEVSLELIQREHEEEADENPE